MNDEEVAKRHTAEHIFMRTLTNMLENVRVIKVEHSEDINKIFLEADELEWDHVIEAARKTNEVIREDRPVRIEYYDSLGEARKKYRDIRAYESRISGRVRIIIIEDYDVSACKMPHVKSTGECIMFLPVSLSKVKGRKYEVKYYAGEDAIYKALEYSGLLVKILRRYNVSKDKIYDFLENLNEERRKLSRSLKELSKEIILNQDVKGDKLKYILVTLPYLDMATVGRALSKRIGVDIDIAFILSYDGEKYNMLFASREDINISEFGRELVSKVGGRGGGRSNWFMGYIEDFDTAIEYINKYLEDITRLL